jgi:hypothetical protein
MGGDDSRKLRPWRGIAVLSGAQQTSGYSKINTLAQRPSAFSPFVFLRLRKRNRGKLQQEIEELRVFERENRS